MERGKWRWVGGHSQSHYQNFQCKILETFGKFFQARAFEQLKQRSFASTTKNQKYQL